MQIDLTNNINFNAPDNSLNPSRKADSTGRISSESADSALRGEYVSVIDKAIESDQVDLTAVEAARKALQTDLDTPEATAWAAENILKFGI